MWRGPPEWLPSGPIGPLREGWYALAGGAPQKVRYHLAGDVPVFEGDIALDPDRIFDTPPIGAPDGTHAAATVRLQDRLWPDGVVPYQIVSDYPERVHRALQIWMDVDPYDSLSFVPVEATTSSDFVRLADWSESYSVSPVGRQGGMQPVLLATDYVPSDVGGIAIGGSGTVYTTWEKGLRSYSVGTTTDLDHHVDVTGPLSPLWFGKYIVGQAAAANETIYTWWSDGTKTVGTNDDLHAISTGTYIAAPGQSYSDIVAIGIHKVIDSRVVAYYRDGTYSIGWSGRLGNYERDLPYSLPGGYSPDDVLSMDFSPANKPYVWFEDGMRGYGAANDDDLSTLSNTTEVAYPGTARSSSVQHELGHAIGLFHEHVRVDRDDHLNIKWHNIAPGNQGAFDTYLNAGDAGRDIGGYNVHSMMQFGSYAFSKNGLATMVTDDPQSSCTPGSHEICPSANLHSWDATAIFDLYGGSALVGVAGAKSDGDIYAWFKDGVRTVGDPTDLTSVDLGAGFQLPAGYTPAAIRGVAIGANDEVFVWYSNGKVSRGTSMNQSAATLEDVQLPPYYSTGHIVAVGYGKTGNQFLAPKRFIFYFSDFNYCTGTFTEPCSAGTPEPYGAAPGYTPWDIAGVARANVDGQERTYTWYKDGARSVGNNLWHLASNGFYAP